MKPWHFFAAIIGFSTFVVPGCKSPLGSGFVSEYAKTLSGFTNVIPTQIEREDGAALTELFQSFYSSENRWPANTDELTAFANLHAPDSALVQRNIEIQITPESNGDVTVSFRSTRGLRRKMRLSPKSTE